MIRNTTWRRIKSPAMSAPNPTRLEGWSGNLLNSTPRTYGYPISRFQNIFLHKKRQTHSKCCEAYTHYVSGQGKVATYKVLFARSYLNNEIHLLLSKSKAWDRSLYTYGNKESQWTATINQNRTQPSLLHTLQHSGCTRRPANLNTSKQSYIK